MTYSIEMASQLALLTFILFCILQYNVENYSNAEDLKNNAQVNNQNGGFSAITFGWNQFSVIVSLKTTKMHALRLLCAARNEVRSMRRLQRTESRSNLEQIQEMPEELFVDRFRLDKGTFRRLCDELRAQTSLRGTREIPLDVKVLCALTFFATGSDQRVVGVSQHLTQRTTSRCIRQVVQALIHPNIVGKWIIFPQTQEARSACKQKFQRKFNLPGVIGCIDCTHIALVKPALDEHQYFNTKGYHSLNIQMVCDSDLKILNVLPKFGGATHDSFIWSSSQAEPYMRALHQNGEQVWLLGDSGYPLRPWLMTPILDAAPGSREEVYTRRHVQARNCIERCFGLLKSRWRCLLKARTLHYQPHVVGSITVACSVLHNMALDARLPPPSDLVTNDDIVSTLPFHAVDEVVTVNNNSQSDLIRGRAIQSCLINRL